MDFYELAKWVSFFYLYSFVGWIWESCYVSVRKRKWVNRGFLNGPVLPIYGFGAVTILFLTSPVEKNIFLVFVIGMIGATVLEYVTGWLMERIFHVRYWDYSNQPLNLNGHICLGCSLGWGLFSVLLVNVVHKPVKRWMIKIPEEVTEIAVVVISILFVADVIWSVNEALDLKKMILQEAEKNQKLQKVQKRMEEIAALYNENAEKYREKTARWKQELDEEKQRIAEEIARLKAEREKDSKAMRHVSKILKRNPSLRSPRHEINLKNIRDLLKK